VELSLYQEAFRLNNLIFIFREKALDIVTLSTGELTEALHAGDEVVFEQMFNAYYQRLCNYANTILDSIEDSEEMVQNTFLNIWEKKESFEIHTSVKSYLYQAVFNQCMNYIKHNKVRQAHKEYYLYVTEAIVGSPSEDIIASELELRIEAAIAGLPPQCQTVFRMSRTDNLTYAEIAKKLGVSVKTVENHMGKALHILRDKLKEYLPLLLLLLMLNNNNYNNFN
jgi:RNA polymerase sigma-70 factor (family 1)